MTKLAIIVHPDGDEEHPITLLNGQKIALRRALRILDDFVGDKEVTVLIPPTDAVADYSKSVAGHFVTDPVVCQGLLSDGSGGGYGHAIGCIDDYIDKRFGLVVVIADKSIAKDLAESFAHRLKKDFGEVRIPGMTNVYVV